PAWASAPESSPDRWAAKATYAATSSASWPLTSPAGIALFRRGCRTCLCTMPSIVSRVIPLASAARKAVSRVGPVVPWGPALPSPGAGAALLREQRLAVAQVGLVAAARGKRQRDRCRHQCREQRLDRVPGEA